MLGARSPVRSGPLGPNIVKGGTRGERVRERARRSYHDPVEREVARYQHCQGGHPRGARKGEGASPPRGSFPTRGSFAQSHAHCRPNPHRVGVQPLRAYTTSRPETRPEYSAARGRAEGCAPTSWAGWGSRIAAEPYSRGAWEGGRAVQRPATSHQPRATSDQSPATGGWGIRLRPSDYAVTGSASSIGRAGAITNRATGATRRPPPRRGQRGSGRSRLPRGTSGWAGCAAVSRAAIGRRAGTRSESPRAPGTAM